MSDVPDKGGRPFVVVDMAKLEALMRLGPKKDDAAAIMGCSADTLERRIAEHAGLTYSEFKEKHFAPTKMSFIQKAITKAQNGDNKMLELCLEELCDWKKGNNKVQVNLQNNISQEIKVEDFDLEARIKQLENKEGQGDGET